MLINDHLFCCSTVSGQRIESEYFEPTEESDKFKQEYEMRRIKQASLCCFYRFVSNGLLKRSV